MSLMESQNGEDDCQIEAVLIKNYQALLPKEYNKLAIRYFDMDIICTKCTEMIDRSDVTICVNPKLNFHFLCLFYEHKFQGNVTDIIGFAKISSEHKEILRTNCQSSQLTDKDDYVEDFSEPEDYEEVALSDIEEEPPTKRSRSSGSNLYSEAYTIEAKPKSHERRMYEQFLENQSAIAFVNKQNPERLWGSKTEDKSARATIKRGTVIDKEFPNASEVHVVRTDRGDLYSITLCQTCISANRNSYFKMQLLKDDDREIYYVFRSWGRIGSKRGSTFSETFHKLQDSTAEFERDFEFLSGNKWRERHFFNPKPNYMWLIEMDYTEAETLICGPDGQLIPAGTKSSLPQEIKQIMLKVFDAKNVNKALDGYGFDLVRMPMGKLTALQISRGCGLLNEAAEQIRRESTNEAHLHNKLMEISNKFYSTLPQSFGSSTPVVLSRDGQIEKMRSMIDALLDIQFVSNILHLANQESAKQGLDPIDMQYKKLMTKMEVVSRDHLDFKLIAQYIKNGAGYTHGYKDFELLDLIRLERYGDAAKFRRCYPNRKLLWHGSPIQNFPGILMHGLRIAPPDALQTGHAFGRGVYFADMISKSAGYCRVNNVEDDNVGYLLLCEVALGNMKKQSWGSGGLTPKEAIYNSIWGIGENYPNPDEDHFHPDGYTIPLGKTKKNTETDRTRGSSLHYNEYIVYDCDQVLHRYLCRVKFIY